MKAKNAVAVSVLCLVVSIASAGEHPIDTYLGACIEADSTTAGMVTCNNQAYLLWDNELNQIYTSLVNSLPRADADALRASQRLWLAFRDGEFKVIDAIYGRKDGSLYRTMRAVDRRGIVMERALQLATYRAVLEN